MKLTELFNSKIDIEVTNESDDRFSTESIIDDRTIIFDAIDDGDYWVVEFGEVGSDGYTISATGSGGELKVLSMVKESLMMLIERYSPKMIKFSAASDGKHGARPRVYKKLVDRFSIQGYTAEVEKLGDTVFTIRKK